MFSTTWAMQYWYLCLIALLIGVATGWWIWGRLAAAARSDANFAPLPDPRPAPAPEPQPVAAPVAAPEPAPVVAPEPVAAPQALGAPAMADDPRFVTNAARIGHRSALTAQLSALTVLHTMQALMTLLEGAGVPCGPVNTVDQVFADPQAQHRSLTVEQTRPDLAEPVRTVASPIRLSKTPVHYTRPPPALGQDTEAVLKDLE